MKMKNKVSPRNYTEKIIDYFGGHIFYTGQHPKGYLYRYSKQSNIWIEAEAEVSKLLRQKLPVGKLSNHMVREVMGDLCQLLHRPMPEEPPWHLVNFRNGVWDALACRFVELGDGNEPPFFLSEIPHEIHPDNTNVSRFNTLFREWVSEDYVQVLYELIAYILIRCNSAQKFFVPYGQGNNGKTTFTNVVKRVVGKGNCSSLSMEEILYNKFALASLHGKLVNITGEIAPTMKRAEKIKLITGGDGVWAEEKFKEGFNFEPYTKLIFMGNVIPETPDSTLAFHRRPLIIPFSNTIPSDKVVRNLVESIAEEEIQGLLGHLVTNTLPAFIEEKFKFSVDPTPDQSKNQWDDLSNPLRTFVREVSKPSPGNTEFVPNAVLGRLYNNCCGEDKRLTAKQFANLMKREGHYPGQKRLSSEEIQRFNKLGFDLVARENCRGWLF
jgi:putative DNA primase/helicase